MLSESDLDELVREVRVLGLFEIQGSGCGGRRSCWRRERAKHGGHRANGLGSQAEQQPVRSECQRLTMEMLLARICRHLGTNRNSLA